MRWYSRIGTCTVKLGSGPWLPEGSRVGAATWGRPPVGPGRQSDVGTGMAAGAVSGGARSGGMVERTSSVAFGVTEALVLGELDPVAPTRPDGVGLAFAKRPRPGPAALSTSTAATARANAAAAIPGTARVALPRFGRGTLVTVCNVSAMGGYCAVR